MKFIFYFNILFLFFISIKSLNLSCNGCSKVVLNTVNNLVFTLDIEPQLIKILYKGTFENPIQFIRLNITKIKNGQYSCKDTFSGYNLTVNLEYLIVVGYQNQDYNTNVYMKFHNYIPNKIVPEQILNSISYYFYVYLENTYLNYNLNCNIELIRQDNSYNYSAFSCEYSRTLNYLKCRLNIDRIGTYYLKVDDVTFRNITLEVIESSFQVLEVRPNYEININENNFYLTLNVDSKLYSSIGHSFEFIIADDSTENRKIILSNCVTYSYNELYCNKISDYFKPLSVYYFYYNQIKLENKNIQTGEQKYPDFKGIEPYDNYYINEGQSNIKKFYINVDDADSLDNSQFYLIDENKSRTNLNNCNDVNSTQILCECNIYKSGEYYINYNNYTISYTLIFINNDSYVNNDNETTPILINDIYLEKISPNYIQLNSSTNLIEFYLYFSNNSSNYKNYVNYISIYNRNNSFFNNLYNCSSSSYYNAIYCYFYANSSYLGYNYIYINNTDTNKYIYIYQNNSYYLITKVYPSQVRYGDINIELTFNEDAYKYRNNVKIGNHSADCNYYASNRYVLECDLYISAIGEYKIYVNNVDTGKILNVNTVTIYDDSSSITNYIKLNIFYLVFIFILFLFNF